MLSDIETLKGKITPKVALLQLAEEAAELSQAALKLSRTLPGSDNPTPVSKAKATERLTEEVADVLLCIQVLGRIIDNGKVRKISRAKAHRWLQRLN